MLSGFDRCDELIKPSTKIINCELCSHIYFGTPPIHRSWACLGSLGKFGFRPISGLKINVGFGPGSGLNVARLQL